MRKTFPVFFNYAGPLAIQLLKETVSPNDYFICTPCRKIWQHIFQKSRVVFGKIFPLANVFLKNHAAWTAIQNIKITPRAPICIVILDGMSLFSQIQIIFFTAANSFPFR